MRISEEKSLLFTADVGRMENQGDLEHSLSFYAPINSVTYGMDGVRIQDGATIPSVFFTGTDITSSLLAFWELEEASGTRVDAHAGHDLTDNNSVVSVAGVVGNAAEFDNTNHLSTTNQDFDIVAASFTMCGWARFNNYTTRQTIISRYGSGERWSLHYTTNAGGRLEFHWKLNTYAILTEPSAGEWHFYIAWYDASAETINFQMDDGSVSSTSVAGNPLASSTKDLLVGGKNDSTPTDFMDGDLDQVGFWTRVLTADERAYLYNSGAGRPYSEMAGSNDPVYTSDSWSNTDKAALLTVNSRYDLYVSGSDIDASKGTFSCHYRADYDYNDSDVNQRYLIDGNNFIQIYYDYAAGSFYGQLYSGAGYTELIVSGANQTFVSGTWIHVAMTYDITKGVYFFVSGTMTDSKSTVWDAETAPANLSIGHISGSGSNSGQGAFDDIRYYKQQLTSAEIYRLSRLNVGLN
jgi:hypothetical protein